MDQERRTSRGRSYRIARFLLAGLIAATVVSACSDNDNSTGPKTPVAASIVLSGGGTAIPVSGTTQFTAVVKDADGNVVDLTPTWSVVAGGGTISASGLFTAGDSAGTFTNTVKATVGSVSSLSSVTIHAGALATITVTPDTNNFAQGATQQFTAVGKDAHGNVISISPSWSVVSGGSIDTAGLYTAGIVAGSFEKSVVATSGDIADSVSVTILPGELATIVVTPSPTATVGVDSTQQFTAVGKDSNGNVVAMTPAWTVEAGGGTIDGTTGLFTAGTVAGEFANTVKATSGAISGTSSVTVTPGALLNLVISPASLTIAAGATQQFTVAGTDSHGNVVQTTPVWQAVSGGTIDDNGLFTASNTAGTYNNAILVTSGTIAAVPVSVTVTAGALATITISPSNPTVNEFSSRTFTAVGKDAHGNTVAITPTWSIASGNSAAGTIGSSSGIFHAANQVHDHTYTNAIVATVGGISGHTSVTVNDF